MDYSVLIEKKNGKDTLEILIGFEESKGEKNRGKRRGDNIHDKFFQFTEADVKQIA